MGRRARKDDSRPTVADVARSAGVSPMTVSRVINREGNVRAVTRARVEEAIAELAYRPNQAARELAIGNTCRIALLHNNPSSAYLSEFLIGSLAQCSTDNAQLSLEDCDRDFDSEAVERRLADPQADGVLLPPPLCDDPNLLSVLERSSGPMAQVATGAPHPGSIAVTINDRAAVRDLVRHLAGLGHRRIAFIEGDPNQTASAARRQGYEDGLAEAEIPFEDALVAQGDFSYRSGLEAGEKLLGQKVRPTAVIGSNDDMAAAIVAVAHRHGFDVPADISVCGFDDTTMATSIWPELTTIRQPIAEMARLATRLLIEAIRDGSVKRSADPARVQMDYELITRGSTAAPPDVVATDTSE